MGKQTYCKSGDKPTVIYSFNNKKEVRFKSRFSPIEVETKSVPVENEEGRYQSKGFKITWSQYGAGIGVTSEVVTDYRIYASPLFQFGYGIARCDCNGKWQLSSDCTQSYFPYSNCRTCAAISPPVVTIDSTVKCPAPQNAKEKCSIIIYHKGIIIHSAQGDCPVNYEVKCGNCKDGEIECKTDHYPGYCCNDCQGKAEEIRRLREAVRRFGL